MKKYIRTQNYTIRKIGQELLMFPIGEMADRVQGTIQINEITAFVWDLFEHEQSIDDIVSRIINDYDISKEEATSYISPLINELERALVIKEID